MPTQCDWISIFQALLTPAIALFAIYIAYKEWWTNDQKRKNDLFDRRYKFYQNLRNNWLSTSDLDTGESTECDLEDLIQFAEEAGFLFGNDIVTHILSLEGKSHTGSPSFPNEDFSLPFRKYLKLR